MSRSLGDRLRIPVIAAPMTGVSGPELVLGCCHNGVVGAFPTHNAASPAELDAWLTRLSAELDAAPSAAPYAVNLVVHAAHRRRDADLRVLIDHQVDVVILSVGCREEIIEALIVAGSTVLVAVASLRHVIRARDAGAHGVVLLTTGAGGQTGSLNPFAFVRAARGVFDGTVVVAGGIADGRSIAAARMLGADLVCMGTRFVSARESLADEHYSRALSAATIDDVVTTDVLTGLPTNVLRTWSERSGGESVRWGLDVLGRTPAVWAAGHGVDAVDGPSEPVQSVVDRLVQEYDTATVGSRSPFVS